MRITSLITIIFLALGCSDEVPLDQAKSCFPQGSDTLILSKALSEKELPHHFNLELKCIFYAYNIRERVEETTTEVFGSPPPPGLNISLGDGNDAIEQLLTSNGVKVDKIVYHGIEFIVWSFEDHEKAEELLKMESWEKEVRKKMREEN